MGRRRFMGGRDPYEIGFYFTSTDTIGNISGFQLSSRVISNITLGGKSISDNSLNYIQLILSLTSSGKILSAQVYVTNTDLLNYIRQCSKVIIKVNNSTISFALPSTINNMVQLIYSDFSMDMATEVSERNSQGERNKVTMNFKK